MVPTFSFSTLSIIVRLKQHLFIYIHTDINIYVMACVWSVYIYKRSATNLQLRTLNTLFSSSSSSFSFLSFWSEKKKRRWKQGFTLSRPVGLAAATFLQSAVFVGWCCLCRLHRRKHDSDSNNHKDAADSNPSDGSCTKGRSGGRVAAAFKLEKGAITSIRITSSERRHSNQHQKNHTPIIFFKISAELGYPIRYGEDAGRMARALV